MKGRLQLIIFILCGMRAVLRNIDELPVFVGMKADARIACKITPVHIVHGGGHAVGADESGQVVGIGMALIIIAADIDAGNTYKRIPSDTTKIAAKRMIFSMRKRLISAAGTGAYWRDMILLKMISLLSCSRLMDDASRSGSVPFRKTVSFAGDKLRQASNSAFCFADNSPHWYRNINSAIRSGELI